MFGFDQPNMENVPDLKVNQQQIHPRNVWMILTVGFSNLITRIMKEDRLTF